MKRIFSLFCVLLCFGMSYAEEWVDVTSQYIINPHYSGNSKTGWVISASYKEDTQYNCQEFFNSTFDMYQIIKGLPNGKYRIGVHGFYRNGDPSTANINGALTAYMYANGSKVLLKSIYTETQDYGYPGTVEISSWPRRVVPHSMQSASYYFAAGKYKNLLEVTVTDGTLKIGVNNNTFVQSNWCILTDWTLEQYMTVSEPSSANVQINEIQVSNIDQFIDPSGNYGGWVELYNPSSAPVRLEHCYVKDHKGHSYKLPAGYGFIPANGYRNIWFDHCDRYNGYTQVPFKLDMKGGTISLCDAQGTVIAQQTYPEAIHRVSYARTSEEGNSWSMTGTPTPAASNAGSQWGDEQIAAPEVDKDGCLFTSNFSIRVSVPAGCRLVYTTDGSTPILGRNSSYSNTSASNVNRVFNISNTMVYRFRLYQDGKLPSDVVTRSFIRSSSNYTAPVVSVVANNADLMGADYGVYVKGNGKGRPGRGQTDACNWNMDWERAVNFEYMVPDGNGGYSETVVNQLVDFEMCGGWSRAWEPHSFKLKANKVYGPNNIDYQFFDSKPYNRHKSLQLRNGGNDSYTGCRFKDAALQEVIRRSGLYVDGQAWQPVHVFINGVYKHVLNMREPNNRHNAYSNYGIDTDYIDQFEMCPDSGYIQMSGTKDAFNLWLEKSRLCADPSEYQFICDSLVDIDSYINYMAVEFYLGGNDWPQNNVKGFRALKDDENGHSAGKFHFVIFDLDAALATTNSFNEFLGKEVYTNDYPLYGIDANGAVFDSSLPSMPIEFVTIFKNMLQNPQFRKQFADAFCIVSGSVFDPDRCQSVIQELQVIENQALAADYTNCNNTANQLIDQLNSTRQSTMANGLKSQLALSTGRRLTVQSNISGANLLLNGQEIPTGQLSGMVYGDIELQAMAPSGYRFCGWSNTSEFHYSAVFGKGSRWNYYCGGSLDNTQWYRNFPSSQSGNAPLAYGNIPFSTQLTANLPTYYFSKQVSLTADQLMGDLQLDYSVDDGFVIYINGTEAGRYKMPTGAVSYNTAASSYAGSVPDEGRMMLSRSLFRAGSNTICVEVHNNNPSSSDICWDASLSCASLASDGNYVSTDSILSLESSSVSLVACFEPLTTDAQRIASFAFPIKVNEVGAANDVYVNEHWKKNDWIELYNNSDMDLDVAGLYVSDNQDKLQKYQIPTASFMANTIIPAHGKMVLWADKLETESQLHTGFKLSNEEGAMVLVSSSEEFESNNSAYFAAHPEMKGFTDVLVYGEHDYNESVGRYPDGGNAIYRMSWPSIGKTNRHIKQNELLGYDQGYQSVLDIEEIAVDDAVDDTMQGKHRETLYYDLLGRRIDHPQSGQLVLRRQYPQK